MRRGVTGEIVRGGSFPPFFVLGQIMPLPSGQKGRSREGILRNFTLPPFQRGFLPALENVGQSYCRPQGISTSEKTKLFPDVTG
jgi:hypothetical protein